MICLSKVEIIKKQTIRRFIKFKHSLSSLPRIPFLITLIEYFYWQLLPFRLLER